MSILLHDPTPYFGHQLELSVGLNGTSRPDLLQSATEQLPLKQCTDATTTTTTTTRRRKRTSRRDLLQSSTEQLPLNCARMQRQRQRQRTDAICCSRARISFHLNVARMQLSHFGFYFSRVFTLFRKFWCRLKESRDIKAYDNDIE